MWKTEFKRYFFSKNTLIILFALISIGLISFYVSYNDRQGFLETLSMNHEDVDNTRMIGLIADYNGIKFVLDFLLTSDFIQIYLILLFLFFGIFLTPVLQGMIESGQENFILSRMTYKEHVNVLLKSQSTYIAVIVSISIIFLAAIGYIWGGVGSGVTGIGNYTVNFGWFLVICIFQIILLILLSVLVNAICLLLNMVIKNKLVLQSLSFGLFIVVPMVISSTIGNLISSIGDIVSAFVPFNLVISPYWFLQYDFDFTYLITVFIPIITYYLLFQYLYSKNIAMYSKDCL